MATLAIITFVQTWNSFLWPLIVTDTDDMRVLSNLERHKSLFDCTACSKRRSISTRTTLPPIAARIWPGKDYKSI